MVKVAVVPLIVPVPSVVEPSLKVTCRSRRADSVAVKVTEAEAGWPRRRPATTVGAAWPTVTVTGLDVAAALSLASEAAVIEWLPT